MFACSVRFKRACFFGTDTVGRVGEAIGLPCLEYVLAPFGDAVPFTSSRWTFDVLLGAVVV